MDYVKADPRDVLMSVRVTNAGPDTDTLHVLPTAWFRNTWSWDVDSPRPGLEATGADSVAAHHPFLGELELLTGPGPDGTPPGALFCENETNVERLYGAAPLRRTPRTASTTTSCPACPPSIPIGAGRSAPSGTGWPFRPGRPSSCGCGCVRRAPRSSRPRALGSDFDEVVARRQDEADEFYAELTPATASSDEALVMRQAFAGMLWSKQFYYYDVARWLDGDPTQPRPPDSRLHGRNARWRGFNAFDIMSMPDKWEYPWFAAWDLAFHCVALAHVDPAFAKYQLSLLCREWFQHSNGALPAYEWDFSDVNPPVQAWAALEVFVIDGGRDTDFLSQIFDKLLVNFTWWVNLQDATGSNLFEGGFLGLDNIGPLDRSHLPVGGTLQQADATGWMASYALAMGTIAIFLDRSGRPTADLVLKFLEHFAAIRSAIRDQGLWDDADGLFYDRLVAPDGTATPVKVRSMVGIIPMLAAGVIDEAMLDRVMQVGKSFPRFLEREGLTDREKLADLGLLRGTPGNGDCSSAWSASTGWSDCSASSSTRPSSSLPTVCGPCPRTTASIRTSSRPRACARGSTTNPPNRPRRCSEATPTGAVRCGSRSTTWSSARWSATTASSATTTPSSTRPGPVARCPSARSSRTCAGGSCRSSRSVRMGAVRASGASSRCRATRPGRTT